MHTKSKRTMIVSVVCMIGAIMLIAVLVPVIIFLVKSPNDYSYAFDANQEKYNLTVKVKKQKVNVVLSSDASVVGEDTVRLISMKAYEYFSDDAYMGISTSISDGIVLGEYKLGTEQTFEIDRYDETGYDKLYNKYYLIGNDNKILKGPVYATSIKSKFTGTPVLNKSSKKGVLAEDYYYSEKCAFIKDLGVSNVTINLQMNSMIYPNEYYDQDGNLVKTEPPTDNFVKFTSNGKDYYFRKNYLKEFNQQVKTYYDLGCSVTVILYAASLDNQDIFPRNLTYYPWSTKDTVLMGLNTSNEYGFGYYIALMEYLAKQHSKQDFKYGYISTFVIGNEIDYAKSYNRMEKRQTDFKVYMEEYSRLLRLSNLAVKKYCSKTNVATSFTHAFGKEGYKLVGNQIQCYAPVQMMEFLNAKSKLEGDYNWGVASHPYALTLSTSSAYEYDTQYGKRGGIFSGSLTPDFLTFTNFEVLDMYLSQEYMQFKGKTRSIYLTEGGISSSGYYGDGQGRDGDEMGNKMQAGYIAALWYKISQIDSVKCFNYYRLIDNWGDGGEGTKYGLLTSQHEKKPAYTVWKYIDTQYSLIVSQPYLQYIKFYDKNGNMKTFENGDITSYLDIVDICGTGYFNGKEFDWTKAMPVTAPIVEEWEIA